MRKLKLETESLEVQSFATDTGAAARRGTIRAAGEGCTYAATCICPTSLYNCGTLHATLVSCEFTVYCDTVADCETLDACPSMTDWRPCNCVETKEEC